MATIVIDPGHGGAVKVGHSGANHGKGPNGTLEKDVTLDLGLRSYTRLQSAGYTVLLTRDTDVNLDLSTRAKVASDNSADAFVSIHLNADDNATIQGTETWVNTVCTSDSILLASSVQARVVGVTCYRDRGIKKDPVGLGVLSMAVQSPGTACCLLEVSFLTDPNDEQRFSDSSYKDSIADAITQGIIDFINRSSSINVIDPVSSDSPGDDGDA